VVVCAFGALCVDDLAVAAAGVADVPDVAELGVAVAVAICPTTVGVGCETVAALFCASIRLPPIVKNDATLRPARRIRLAAAGWRRRFLPVVAAGRAAAVAVGLTASVERFWVGAAREVLDAARRSWSRRIHSAWSVLSACSVI
jgi:hypothetical protein